MLRRFVPAFLVAVLGGALGAVFSGVSLEAADWTTPAYARGSDVYVVLVSVCWALLPGLAFSPLFGFPPSRPTIGTLLWHGALRGAIGAVLVVSSTAVFWTLLELGGPAKPGATALIGSPAEWFSSIGALVPMGLIAGALFAVLVGREP